MLKIPQINQQVINIFLQMRIQLIQFGIINHLKNTPFVLNVMQDHTNILLATLWSLNTRTRVDQYQYECLA